ncbi:macrophage mannose receptor 1-like isoform X3 [Schistocerca nitens]|nr:macrophage mannose receptor 1-like isoform X3 [Schistocerca nitens]XP_049801450.1 macrophage mannose receptor 1-like isoform X3 [Schistocerca nitens]
MQLLPLWTVLAAVATQRSLASVQLTCDCRMWQLRDPSISLHCSRREAPTPGVSCQQSKVWDIPRGYQFVPGYGLVKLYRTFKTWWAAKKACEADGSRLAIPPDRNAVDGLNQIFAKENGLWWAWVGISDEAREGVFVGVDGRPAPFLPWQPKQPSDHEGKENCVNTRNDGLYNDLNCDWQSPFFCERLLSVGVPDSYRWLEEAGRFYKVHKEKRRHNEAAEVCRSENATLAVTDTWRRGEALLRTLITPESLEYHIGFTDRAVEGDFVTDTGRHLSDMEFLVWGYGEPKNRKDEDCLSLNGEGYYTDISCEFERPFICEIVP